MQRAQTTEERAAVVAQLAEDFFLPPLHAHRYSLQLIIGEGSYGVVCAAVDEQTGERVAVKRVRRIFEHAAEAVRTLRELKLMRLLRAHDNIVTIKDVLLPSERDRFDDVFVVMELMPTDLSRVLRSNIDLSNDHVRWLLYQLLRGIHYLHSSNVFHRDLKPSNILINASCDLRIGDFGLARAPVHAGQEDPVFWTDYVATRWYRAPELILAGVANYTTAIDVWSAGCIFAEMLNGGLPMFPGENSTDQLECVVDICGTPSPDALAAIREPRARAYLAAMPPRPPRALVDLFPNADSLARDLLQKLLEFDPAKRLSAREAMEHAYFAPVHHPASLDEAAPALMDEFEFERQGLDCEGLRALFLEEILRYHPDKREQYMQRDDQQMLEYAPVDQAARFRRAFLAKQSGTEPPRPWESMPNQQFTTHFGGIGAGSTHAVAASRKAEEDMTPESDPASKSPVDGPMPGSTVVVQQATYATSQPWGEGT